MKSSPFLNYVRVAAKAADDKKGQDIVAYDVRKLTSLTDAFMFVSGNSHVHVKSLEDEIRNQLKEAGADLKRIDGQRGYPWRVLDYGDILIHIMDQATRDFYSMERLWSQGRALVLFPKPKKAPVKTKKLTRS